MELTVRAYPKVNIHLAVGKKRPDGFHEISSIFQLVKTTEFYDDIRIDINREGCGCITVCGLEGVADEKNNTVYSAVRLFAEQIDERPDIKVNITKRIPSQAGLGGGSSDAGSVILALNRIYNLNRNVLLKIAEQVGSDVPFFIYGCDAAVVLGRGEKVYPIPAKNLKITLYPNANKKMSTKDAYAMLDERNGVSDLFTLKELKKMYEKPVSDWEFFNDFSIVNEKNKDPRMLLTGSGTCFFTID